ncbi:MAG: prolyl oligopeptidase family serine peptidase [Pirellulaceae bacterium]
MADSPLGSGRAMETVMGPFPANRTKCDLDVRIESEEDAGSYVRRLISYQSEEGCRTPAYLQIPKTLLTEDVNSKNDKALGVLCLHPTDNVVGHQVVVGLGGKPNRQYAAELAERGFVTIAPAYPLLANYQPDWRKLGYASGTMKAVWDNVRALDVLESLPFVQPGKFGAIGHSLGGHNAVYSAVFDQRIQVIVSSCGLDSYTDYMNGDITGWTSDRYMPKLLAYRNRVDQIPFDFHEMIAALAPRPVLISAPLGDTNFQWQSVDRIAEAARPIFELSGATSKLLVVHPDCDHDFPDNVRKQAYAFIDKALRP